ncbi:uncharacterized protein [Phyllobates terribilis]|uniref:uncharacterized protein isoform X1 n=2 Tax=Phyllobates terribilis TaxID=111132 RepID=UPI003CCA74C5
MSAGCDLLPGDQERSQPQVGSLYSPLLWVSHYLHWSDYFSNTAEMFITVLYGESEETLFNINCKVQLLLESIKNLCHYENEGEIELADEGGQVKNLQENQQRYASELLGERETCVLLAMTRSPDSSDVIFTPLLNDDTIVNAKFLAKLGNWGESKDSSRKLKTKKSNRKGTVVISTSPEVSGKQSTSVRKRSVRS